MGDKSPKSTQRNQKQKQSVKAESQARAQSKQDGHSQAQPLGAKGKK